MRKIFPKNIKYILADLIREEIRNKLTIVGMYSSDLLLLLKDLTPGQITALPGIYILAQLEDGQGKFDGKFIIRDPKGTALKTGAVVINKPNKKRSFGVILPITPFLVSMIGRYHLELTLDKKHKYDYFFEIDVQKSKK